jgi:exopolysaccharide biosynthesis polyprenyl glycosylphosphotransferase
MNQDPVAAILVRRFSTARTMPGRMRLSGRVLWKQATWRAVITGAESLKRTMDIMLGALALICLAPLFALVAILIKVEDGGPVFFRQRRVGRHGEEFFMFKFRSMCIDAEEKFKQLLAKNQHAQGVTFKMKDDPRITHVGKWLRKFSIDEFPQFYNVLIGDMSLVGPRPPVPREVALYTAADRRRLAVPPGLTCFWQVSGRSEIDFDGQVQLDVQYIESQSFWLDLKLLFKTIPAVLFGKGAY